MQTLMVNGLQAIATLLDKAIPLQGGRTLVIAMLTIGGNVAMFLTGTVTAELAASNVLVALGLIYASLHKPK